MSVSIALIKDVQEAYCAAKGLPATHVLTEADFQAVEAAHKKWVKAGGVGKLPTGKEAPLRSVLTITTSGATSTAAKVTTSYVYKDKQRQFTPPSMLPEVLAFLPGAPEQPPTAGSTRR